MDSKKPGLVVHWFGLGFLDLSMSASLGFFVCFNVDNQRVLS